MASVHVGDSISTVEAIQYCGGLHQYMWGIVISTAEAIQYCGVKFSIFLYLADIVNQKLSAFYNFETKIALDFYRNLQLR